MNLRAILAALGLFLVVWSLSARRLGDVKALAVEDIDVGERVGPSDSVSAVGTSSGASIAMNDHRAPTAATPRQKPLPNKTAGEYWDEADKFFEELGISDPFTADLALLMGHCMKDLPGACLPAEKALAELAAQYEKELETFTDPDERAAITEKLRSTEAQLRNVVRQGCETGITNQCYAAFNDLKKTGEHGELEALARSYCESGLKNYCVSLGEFMAIDLHSELDTADEETPESLERLEQARDINSRGCDAGSTYSCRLLVNGVLGDDEDSRSQRAMEELHRSCQHESPSANLDSSCAFLASSLADRGEVEKAWAYGEQACTNGYREGCLEVARLAYNESADPAEAFKYLRQYCELSDANGSEACAKVRANPQLTKENWQELQSMRVSNGKGHESTVQELFEGQ